MILRQIAARHTYLFSPMIAAPPPEIADTAGDLGILVAGIAQKNPASLAQFYDQTSTLVYSVALRILNNAADAADAVQETYVSIWTRAATFDATRGNSLAWAVAIGRHKAIDRWRMRQRREQALDGYAFHCENTDTTFAAPAGLADPEARLVRAAVAELAPRDRQVLELAYFRGHTQREISERLQEPVATIKARIRRALFKLRTALAAVQREMR